MKPKRIEIGNTRTGWKLPPNTVWVAPPSKWANPYRIGRDGNALACMFKYHILIAGVMENDENRVMREAAQRELAGKNLACWCKLGDPCHIDTLIEVANKIGRFSDDFREKCMDCDNLVENKHDAFCMNCQQQFQKPSGPLLVCTPQMPNPKAEAGKYQD